MPVRRDLFYAAEKSPTWRTLNVVAAVAVVAGSVLFVAWAATLQRMCSGSKVMSQHPTWNGCTEHGTYCYCSFDNGPESYSFTVDADSSNSYVQSKLGYAGLGVWLVLVVGGLLLGIRGIRRVCCGYDPDGADGVDRLGLTAAASNVDAVGTTAQPVGAAAAVVVVVPQSQPLRTGE